MQQIVSPAAGTGHLETQVRHQYLASQPHIQSLSDPFDRLCIYIHRENYNYYVTSKKLPQKQM